MDSQNDIGYNIQVTRQTALLGEMITITTNAPTTATLEDLKAKIRLVTTALEDRLSSVNEKVVARTGKNLDQLGLAIPGFTSPENA